MEYSNCGVGFLVSLKNDHSHDILQVGLKGLKNVEHRGGSDESGKNGDGAGIMTSIPKELLGIKDNCAVATIFAPNDKKLYQRSLEVFEQTFAHYYLFVDSYREVPTKPEVLGEKARKGMPKILQAIIKRPKHCRTHASFNEVMYMAKQMVRTKQREAGIKDDFYFTSLSSRTIVYKALCTSSQLEEFYPDLKKSSYKTNFAVFHRRFSTNTLPSWDKVQPFRLLAHNGEINTIEGNRSAAISREKSIGLRTDQLITHHGSSDSGNLNGMVEALKYRSSIPHINEILAIMIPPANSKINSPYFHFWSRAMEPWDGPALVNFCDGKRIGARLDRSGFRPCRWHRTEDIFYLCSEAGSFEIPTSQVMSQGELYAGRSVSIHMFNGEIDFNNPNTSEQYKDAFFDPRVQQIPYLSPKQKEEKYLEHQKIFYYTKEDLNKELFPMIQTGTEPIGSMGDTARLSALSDIHRSIYYYFYQNFAQVTNPPLDYIREKMVTDLEVYLGRKPNIFEPKELIPPPKAISLPSPIIGLGQLEMVIDSAKEDPTIKTCIIDICFKEGDRGHELKAAIDQKVQEAISAVQTGHSILILSDRKASRHKHPIPAILVMRAIQVALTRKGVRLRVSIVVDTGEVHNAHQAAVLIGFGASAVCPYLALEMARHEKIPKTEELSRDQREKQLLDALESGLMRIMAKRGISVVRSYQGSELFTILGLGKNIMSELFSKHPLIIGNVDYDEIAKSTMAKIEETQTGEIPNSFIYKEQPAGKKGEKHAPTTKATRKIHDIIKIKNFDEAYREWSSFTKEQAKILGPLNIRDLFHPRTSPIEDKIVESREEILKRFGCGAMSFGAISAEAQRDLILAFEKIGGRSNSGEGGENPYYYSEGISASIKQIASGRFGVTAEYLVTGQEVQIKMAQGAKPGEGGQLPGHKVNKEIAFARHSTPGVGLISPPPQHDIYSIEDLKQLIYEIKQLSPKLKVSVKLVSGHNIGAIALGVVKAGADIIQISGGSGGTGAASLMSMKYTGLPWEIGLLEVHKLLVKSQLRDQVILRVDGGLISGQDLYKATLFGAEQFDFGKMALISQGCIMARVCEKNTCPTGIATQDPKFKEKYKGSVEDIVTYLNLVAEELRQCLVSSGFENLNQAIGQIQTLVPRKDETLDLSFFQGDNQNLNVFFKKTAQNEKMNSLNKKILEDFKRESKKESLKIELSYPIKSTDRAIPLGLSGYLASENSKFQLGLTEKKKNQKQVYLNFFGSAGQGFGAFTGSNTHITLEGEANDSFGKAISGGTLTLRLPKKSQLHSDKNILAGNVCLYGATGGRVYLGGLAGDRFAIRNSGVEAVVEGVGLHACEYMTGGKVIILGRALDNIGAGMTGGILYCHKANIPHINEDYLQEEEIDEQDYSYLKNLLKEYYQQTNSLIAKNAIDDFDLFIKEISKFIPK